jgi:hypothetical protein
MNNDEIAELRRSGAPVVLWKGPLRKIVGRLPEGLDSQKRYHCQRDVLECGHALNTRYGYLSRRCFKCRDNAPRDVP